MRFKKIYLKTALLLLVLSLVYINYELIISRKHENQRLWRLSSNMETDHAGKLYMADFESSDVISKNFLKDPIINKDTYTFIHASENTCTGKPVDLLVIMQSSVIDFDHRKMYRRSWRSRSNVGMVQLFFVGGSNTNGLWERVDYEARLFGDIVQADVLDSPQNKSLLSAMMLKWISIYCSNISFVVKRITDDELPFVKMLQALRRKEIDYKYFVMGNSAVLVQTPLRYVVFHYYKSISEYQDSSFSVFIQDPVYAFPARTALVLYQAYLRTKLFWNENVYITGVCTHRATVPVFFDVSFVSAS